MGLENTACSGVNAGVVSGVQVADNHAGLGRGRMDKLSVSNVDAHVGGTGGVAVGAVEEDQVAGLQVLLADRGAVFQLLGRGAVDIVAEMLVDIPDQTGAIERLRTAGTQHIGIAQELACIGYDLRLLAGVVRKLRSWHPVPSLHGK